MKTDKPPFKKNNRDKNTNSDKKKQFKSKNDSELENRFEKKKKDYIPSPKKDFGEKRNFRKSFGDGEKRFPRKERSSEFSRDNKDFGEKRNFRKSFGDGEKRFPRKERSSEFSRDNKDFGEKRNFRKSFGDGEKRFPRKERSSEFNRDNKDFGEKRNFRKSFGDGEKRFPRKERSSEFSRDNKDFGEKRNFRKSFGDGEKRFPRKERSSEFNRDNKDFGEKRNFRKSFGNGEKRFPRKERSSEFSRDNKDFGEKRNFRKSFGDGEKRFPRKERSSEFSRDNKDFGEKRNFRSSEKPKRITNRVNDDKFYGFLGTEEKETPKPKKITIKSNTEEINYKIEKERFDLLEDLKEKDTHLASIHSTDPEEELKEFRINRFLARAGLGSRREVESLILNGEIKVNGEVEVNLARKVNIDTDTIEYNGNRIELLEEEILLAFNKPIGYLCSHKDIHHDKTVFHLLPDKFKRLNIAGRLDLNSRGLMIFSNRGEVLQQITHPSKHLLKKYLIKLNKPILKDDFILTFLRGIDDENEFLRAEDIKILDYQSSVLEITLGEGKKRQIHRMFNSIGFEVIDLQRVQIGKLKLDTLDLKEGEYKLITKDEVFI